MHAGQVQGTLVHTPFDQARKYPATGLSPLQELISRFLKLAPVGLHPKGRTLEIAEAHVEGKTDERIENSLTASSSRTQSKYTTLKTAKVFSKKSVNFSHGEDSVPARGYRYITPLLILYPRVGWVNYVAHADRPQKGRTAVRLSPHPFVVLDHLDGGGGDFHFLLNA
jgi:hypothetical protein